MSRGRAAVLHGGCSPSRRDHTVDGEEHGAERVAAYQSEEPRWLSA